MASSDQVRAWEQIFTHMPHHKIVVCKSCQYAVVPDQIKRHLKDHHPSMSVSVRGRIAEEVLQIQDLAHIHQDVSYPERVRSAIKGLKLSQGGLECQWEEAASEPEGEGDTSICGVVLATRSGMYKHCKEVHGWRNMRGQGGSMRQRREDNPSKVWEEGIWYQRFFATAGWRRNFRVQVETEGAESKLTREQKVTGEKLAEQYKKGLQRRRETGVIAGPGNRYEANPWLEMMGWMEHLAGFEKTKITHVIRAPVEEMTGEEKQAWEVVKKQRERREVRGRMMVEEEEAEEECEKQEMDRQFGDITNEEAEERDAGLWEASKATAWMIQEALQACTVRKVGNAVLEYVDRAEFGGKPDWRPFYARQKAKTIVLYTEVWVKILRYIWRTADVEEGKRPGYRMSGAQMEWLERVQGLTRSESRGKEWRREMTDTLGEFWMSMLDQLIKADHHESVLISGLAVLGLNTVDGGWARPENFTPKIAALVTVGKALVIRQAWKDREEEASEVQAVGGCSIEEARWQVRDVYERVQKRMQGRMTVVEFGSKPNVMDRLLRMLKYGREIRNRTKGEARVRWEGEKIMIDKVQFTMGDLRKTVHGILETARRRLRVELMRLDEEDGENGEKMPVFDISKIRDAPGELQEGFSFLDLQENDWEVDGYEWMIGRLHDRLGKMEGETWVLKDKETAAWIKQLKRFKEELFVLVHLTGGAPARGTEITSIRLENGPEGRTSRGVFVDRGTVSFVTTYNKTSGMSKRLRTIHRYVPKEVGELVIYYLWLVEPFVRQLNVKMRDLYELSGYMWEPEPEWEGEVDENDDNDDNNDEENDDNSDEEDDNNDDDEEVEEEETEKEEMEKERGKGDERGREESINLDGYWGTDRRRRVISREVESRIGVKLTTALWRQAYPAIQRKFAGDEKVRELLDGVYDEGGVMMEAVSRVKIRGKGFNAREEQAGHTRWMEELIYGVLYNEAPDSTLTEREEFRKVSLDWHRFLHFKSGWEDVVEGEEVARKAEARAEAERFMRWKRIREMDLEGGLQALKGVGARFRGVQRKALKAIVSGTRRVMVVMGTGKGKSLLFMLPAKVSQGGLTIVVVPLNSLRDDMVRRCEEAGIESAEWSQKRPAFGAKIVFVTPESAVTKAFARFMESRKVSGGLDRIVVDECHMLLDANAKWRPKMLEMEGMMDKGVQVVFLTATMRPKDEGEFLGLMGLKEEEVMWVREATTRKNVGYSVREYSRKDELAEVKMLVEEKLSEYEAGKIVIYCNSIDRLEDVAKEVGGEIYNAQMGNEEMKKKVLRRMVDGRERVWVATNALGVGIDIPDIRVVIHVGVKRKIRDYVQESGRAGRDGRMSEGITMRAVQKFGFQTIGIGERGVEDEMKELLLGEVCRRKVIDREMDGRSDRMGCEVREVKCDVCQGVARGGKRRRMVVNNEEDEMRATQRRRLQEREGERERFLYDLSSDRVEREVRDQEGESVEELLRCEGIVRGEENALPTSDSGLGLGVEFEWEDSNEEEEKRRQGSGMEIEEGLGMEIEEGSGMRDDEFLQSIKEIEGELMTGQVDRWGADGGGWQQEENSAALAEWRRQREGYEMEERRRIASKVGGRELIEELEEKLKKWSKGCIVCRAIGEERGKRCKGENWKECELVTEVEREAMEVGMSACKKIQLERFAGCWTCWMPREGCRRYREEGRNRGGWRRFHEVEGMKCQWGNLLKEICVGLVMFCPSEELEKRWGRGERDEVKWREVLEKHRIEEGSGLARTVKGMTWLTKKVNIRGIEMNEGTGTVLYLG